MNFIRFVKTPRIDAASPKRSAVKKNVSKKPSSTSSLSMILTITTDFSTFAGYAELAVQLISPTKGILSEQRTLWTDTSRELKVDIPIAEDSKEAKVVVFPIGPIIPKTSTPFLSKFVCRPLPHIVGVESPRFAPKTAARIDSVYREFVIDGFPFRIAEQSGETIIRHVWDAGIILSAAATCNPVSLLPDELQTFMQMTGIYGATKILEMGTGVGVLGISLAAQFPEAKVVVTDLEDAEPFVRENISINSPNFPHLRENISFRTLDGEIGGFRTGHSTKRSISLLWRMSRIIPRRLLHWQIPWSTF